LTKIEQEQVKERPMPVGKHLIIGENVLVSAGDFYAPKFISLVREHMK
jgi:hypothetical protein